YHLSNTFPTVYFFQEEDILSTWEIKFPRGYFLFPKWKRKNSSEVSFHSSEVSFDSSEVLFLAYVGNFYFSRGYFGFPTRESNQRYDVRE
ncbi:hypothetical protein, partial [uncultured Porphyromonas sp.]|uniref:hypothetical protein n=1 Tax=uncultured Porphyromonas sp. TaxID=159274 RepID=UPI0028051B10